MTSIKEKLETATQQLTGPGAPYELTTAKIDGVEYRLFKNAPDNLRSHLEPARAHAEKEFILYEGERWTFQDTFDQADRIAHQLVRRHGIQKGDRVAIAMRNYPEWMTAFLGIVNIGAVAAPINSWGEARDLEFAVRDAGAKLIFCDERRFQLLAPHLAELDVHAVVARPSEPVEHERAETLESFLQDAPAELPEVDIGPEDLAMIFYTSGTTGQPKGVASTQRQVIQATLAFDFSATSSAIANPEAIAAMMGSGLQPTALLVVPLFHCSGLYPSFLGALRGGRRLAIPYRWDADRVLDLIEAEKITTFGGVPSMVLELLQHPRFDEVDTSSLKALGGGGAPQPPLLGKLIAEKVPDNFAGTGYGLTETNATGSSSTGAAYTADPRSAGLLQPICEIRTCDEDGELLPPGETGELWLKSVANAKGYWHRPEADAEYFQEGWFRTGDIGYLNEEGFLYVVDRAKDVVIRGGENIASADVESILYEHPAIAEVAAFGLPHDILGEELAVAIRLKEGQRIEPAEVQAFVAERTAKFKVPSKVFLRSEPLPKNATGKLMKRTLREEYLGS